MRTLTEWAPRVLVLGVAWYVISAGDPESWLVGAPAVLLAAAIQPPRRGPGRLRWWRLDHLARFVFFYLAQAIAGGVDVALRALHPRREVAPDFVTYRLRIPRGPATSLLAVTISMLPGTVAADTVGRRMVVQRIHPGIDVQTGCRRAEERVARLFGLSLTGHDVERGEDD
jgi:multicomponent Na+:H+ antiporter subunit E